MVQKGEYKVHELRDNTRETRNVKHLGIFFLQQTELTPVQREGWSGCSLLPWEFLAILWSQPVPESSRLLGLFLSQYNFLTKDVTHILKRCLVLLLCLLQILSPETLILSIISQSTEPFYGRGHKLEVLCKRDVLCKEVSMQLCLKLCCEN